MLRLLDKRYAPAMRNLAIDAAARVSRSLPPLRGRGRVALLLQQWAHNRQGSWAINMRRGHRMVVPVNSAQSWRAAFTGSYDDEEIELVIPYIEPASLVLDVGASLGFYTIPLGLAARQVGARVVAIEPVGRNCDVIRRNVQLNSLEDVVSVIQCALGRMRGQVMLHIESGGTGNATIVTGLDPADVERHDKAGKMGSMETVPVRRLDDLELLPEDSGRRCSLIKVDVEGFEMDILAGAERFIAKHRPALFAEFNPIWLDTRGIAATAPTQWAAANAYVCEELLYTRPHPVLDVKKASLRTLIESAPRSGTDLVLLPRPMEKGSP